MTRAPAWFTGAIANAGESRGVEVAGCEIRYQRWGETDRPGVVLVHGGAAHSRWWDFIGPMLTPLYHVVAPDLSGHGDSGRRDEYGPEMWSDEVMAVAEHAGIVGAPIVIGHSMGGLVTIVTAARYGDRLAGAIAVDSPVRRPDPESEEGERGRMFKRPKTYPDLDTALDHFHLAPPQPCDNDFVLDHIARHSLIETPDGWTWKFDRRVFERERSGIDDYLADARCRVAMLYGELSALVTPDVQEYMDELIGHRAPIIEIPQAHHHVLLDQPLALVAALRAILADWEHSVPRRQ
jgi:pimeloyl-ACP methyl ester carboxylesterase